MPTDHGSSDGRRRSSASVDVELHAAMALADMAGVGVAAEQAFPAQHHAAAPAARAPMEHEDEELASTRLSLELGNVGIQSSPCSGSSSGAGHQPLQSSAAVPGYGLSRPRHMLTEAEKEAKRLRRVLANRESARQTILRRQAIRDELERKVADLASQNENMKKEKDIVLEQYLSLKETNKQLKQQAHHLLRSFNFFLPRPLLVVLLLPLLAKRKEIPQGDLVCSNPAPVVPPTEEAT